MTHRQKKETAAATCLYPADCDGEEYKINTESEPQRVTHIQVADPALIGFRLWFTCYSQ